MPTFTLTPALNKNRIFILQKSEMEKRLDPYFYIPKFKDLESKLKAKKTKKISEIALKVFSGSTPLSKGDAYTDNLNEGIPFVRSGDFNIDGSIDFENLVYLKPEIHEKQLKSSQLKNNDLLFAIVGATIGKVGVYKNERSANINQAICAVRIKEGFNIDFLNAYFQTSIGQGLIDRIKRPVARANINLDEIATLPIILPNEGTQKKIVDIFNLSLQRKKQNEAEAEELLASIDEYLLKALGIQLPKSPENSLKNRIFTISFNSFSGTRVDPNFHKSEYANIVKAIQSVKHQKLAKIVDFSNETWDQNSIFTNTFPYIEISEIDISTGLINQIVEIEKKDAPSRAKMIVRNEDILVSTTRPNRGAIALYRNSKEISIASTGFAILRKKLDGEIDTEYLWFILKNIISLKQMEQRSSGGNYPAITQEELGNILIPVPPLEKQKEIADHITSIRAQAKKLKEKTNQALASASQEIEAILLG